MNLPAHAPVGLRFAGTTAIVMGAAKGIGAAASRRLLAEGAHVVAIDLDEGGLRSLEESARSVPGQLIVCSANALDEADVERAFACVPAEWAPLSVLVNAVGGSMILGNSRAELEAISLANWKALLSFNLDATFLACRRAIPIMKRERRGCIVNVASTSAHGRGRANAAYTAAKAGVIAMTRKLSLELAPYGVRCNAIAPGLTRSERVLKDFQLEGEGALALAESRIPLGRLALPEEQASLICYLASAEAAYITGVSIDVSGGV
ncbi:MAG: SDR family oxidoreductase [Burkholderiaceae bacterium]|nr:SDR family oxidoreductase [Burkholderiaceae bacterium]